MNFVILNPLITPDLGLAFWTIVTFVLLLYILGKFAWKPIVTALKNREQSISEALGAAIKAREEMKLMSAENEKLLQQARIERDMMLREAREIKDKMIVEAKEQAQDEGRKILAQAQENIERERERAFKELKSEVAVLAIEAASKIIRKELSDKNYQEELIGEYLKEAKAN
jgi:F-type H+-transporting ATPase subunit b